MAFKYRDSKKYRSDLTYRGKTSYTQVSSNSTTWADVSREDPSWTQATATGTWTHITHNDSTWS
jgi:hypothetical protein